MKLQYIKGEDILLDTPQPLGYYIGACLSESATTVADYQELSVFVYGLGAERR